MACAATALFGMCSALSPSYWWYLVLRCVAGAGVASVTSMAFLLAVEPVGPAWRGVAALGSGYGSAAGACLLPFLAFLLPGWRALTFVTSALAGVALCTVVPVVPESPRWLLSTGRKVTGHTPPLAPSLPAGLTTPILACRLAQALERHAKLLRATGPQALGGDSVACSVNRGVHVAHTMPRQKNILLNALWVLAQGDATAALAAIASRNKTHLPEAPLADAAASVAARRGILDILGNARLRRRIVLILYTSCFVNMVSF